MSYHELSVEERATIQIGHIQGLSQRRIARLIERSPSTISRELRRNREVSGRYSAPAAQQQMQARRQTYRPMRKLLPGTERFELVAHMLRERWSPEQIAGKLRSMNIPSLRDAYVCRETIYNAIYALPVGELRKELIICLRQGKTTRRPRSGGVDRRGQCAGSRRGGLRGGVLKGKVPVIEYALRRQCVRREMGSTYASHALGRRSGDPRAKQ